MQPSYRNQINHYLENLIHSMGDKSPLRDACAYALQNGGKRLRPIIVLAISDALGCPQSPLEGAGSVELFHTASLIADDLPCMDNALQRREKPTLHIAYNEATALLATYALISKGYDLIAEQAKKTNNPHLVLQLSLASATYNTGILGITGGQYVDLFPDSMDEELICDLMRKKTGTLFELSFVFGWLFGGGDPEKLPIVKEAAHHFGLSFQLKDDLDDLQEDLAAGKKGSYAVLFGLQKTDARIKKELSLLQEKLSTLKLNIPLFENLVN